MRPTGGLTPEPAISNGGTDPVLYQGHAGVVFGRSEARLPVRVRGFAHQLGSRFAFSCPRWSTATYPAHGFRAN